jgi:radical SAM protein with 4Fe4S-binding SPASM domain
LISCYAGRLNLVLTETGELFPCEEFSLSMGKVQDFDYNIRNLLKGAKARKVLSFIRDKGCYCTHECYFMTNILFNPRLYPELFKEYHSLGK